MTEKRGYVTLKIRIVSGRRTFILFVLPAANSVTKRVHMQECYREVPTGEREHRKTCGRWLLRGAVERSVSGAKNSGKLLNAKYGSQIGIFAEIRKAATGPPVTAGG